MKMQCIKKGKLWSQRELWGTNLWELLTASLGAKTNLVHFTTVCGFGVFWGYFLVVYTGIWQSEYLVEAVTAGLPNVS